MVRLAVACPDDRGALVEELAAPFGLCDPVAQRDERERRFDQSAEDRQSHPGVGRIPSGDPPQGLQRGQLVVAAIS